MFYVLGPPTTSVVPVFTSGQPQGDHLTVAIGDQLTLECSSDGWPLPTIRWEKYGGHLPAGRHFMMIGQFGLIIENSKGCMPIKLYLMRRLPTCYKVITRMVIRPLDDPT